MSYFTRYDKVIVRETNKLLKTYNGLNVIFLNEATDEKFFNKLYIGQDIGVFDVSNFNTMINHIINFNIFPDKTLIKTLYNNVTVIAKKNRLYYYGEENCYIGNLLYDSIDKKGKILKDIAEKEIAFNENEKNDLIKKQLDNARNYISSSPLCLYHKTKIIEFICQIEDFYNIQ